MRIPKVKKRRLYDSSNRNRDGYLESDADYLLNNQFACVWFLDNREQLNILLKSHKLAKVSQP